MFIRDQAAPTERERIHITASRGWISLHLGELWSYRELLFFLVWRNVKVRYKQTALGVAWAVLQPLVTMVVFSVFFGRLVGVPSDGLPYPVFTYTALLPWQLFAQALTESSNSLVSSQHLITKVYFPRLVIPLSAVLSGLVDFCFSFFVLLGLLLFYGIAVTLNIVALPVLVLLTLATALSVGLWLSALGVQYRDVRYIVPFLTQSWLFITPIAYSSSLVPERWRGVYGLNPMTGVVEGFRWALLGQTGGTVTLVAVSSVAVALLLIGGLIYFRRAERVFADVV
jgi:lipopolysaccharide transport system permease protein